MNSSTVEINLTPIQDILFQIHQNHGKVVQIIEQIKEIIKSSPDKRDIKDIKNELEDVCNVLKEIGEFNKSIEPYINIDKLTKLFKCIDSITDKINSPEYYVVVNNFESDHKILLKMDKLMIRFKKWRTWIAGALAVIIFLLSFTFYKLTFDIQTRKRISKALIYITNGSGLFDEQEVQKRIRESK